MTTVQSSILVKPFGAKQQAIICVGDKHFVVGAPQIHDTVTAASRPIDLLLATLATDCTFTCQEGAAVLGLPIGNVSVAAHWTEPAKAEIRFAISGVNNQQIDTLARYIQDHSQIYALLSPSISIVLRFIG